MTNATVAQAGASAFAVASPEAEISQAGVAAFAANSPNAQVCQAGILAWVRQKKPYLAIQAGAVAFALLKPHAMVVQAGVYSFAMRKPAAVVSQAGVLAWVRYVGAPVAAALTVARKPGTQIDAALTYDQNFRALDAVFNGTDFELDLTPASVLLHSLLVDRRAHPDDTWPPVVPDWANPSSFTARGGYPGDALDPNGQLSGSRLWELDRRLANDQTRSDCQDYVVEGVEPLEKQRGYAIQVQVAYELPQILGYSVTVGSTTVALKKALG